jgi:hypothetical protein
LVLQLKMASITRYEESSHSGSALLMTTQMALPEKSDYKPLETIVSNIVKEKQVFQRLTLSKEDL